MIENMDYRSPKKSSNKLTFVLKTATILAFPPLLGYHSKSKNKNINYILASMGACISLAGSYYQSIPETKSLDKKDYSISIKVGTNSSGLEQKLIPKKQTEFETLKNNNPSIKSNGTTNFYDVMLLMSNLITPIPITKIINRIQGHTPKIINEINGNFSIDINHGIRVVNRNNNGNYNCEYIIKENNLFFKNNMSTRVKDCKKAYHNLQKFPDIK